MASVSKSVLVRHSAHQLFALVEAADDYPAFLPWCGGVQTLERTADTALVRIDIDFHGVRTHFTTANTYHRPDSIILARAMGRFAGSTASGHSGRWPRMRAKSSSRSTTNLRHRRWRR